MTKKKYYGTQFHPEVVHTPDGGKLIANFVRHLRLHRRLDDGRIPQDQDRRNPRPGGRRVDLRSFGCASIPPVAAVCDPQAIGDQPPASSSTTGLMRLGEAEQVVSLFRNHYHIRSSMPTSPRCSWAVRSAADPEAKRKFIGKTFIDVFEAEAKKIGGADFLAPGTLYPDVIERLVHRRAFGDDQEPPQLGGLPERMNMKLVRLPQLFKDEVRAGRELGLPDIFVGRHPFPGPGLPSASPAKSTASARTSCARPMRSTSKIPGASTTRSGRPSRYSSRSRRWA
jgi:GMP synthase (glutamine-hydrolysing)